MSKLKVLRFPDARLRTVAKPVEAVDDDVRKLVSDMYETMYDKAGVGLAATQVNVHRRVVVTDCPVEEDKPKPITFINPQIVSKSADFEISQEGCLSVPEIYADVERAKTVVIKAQNEQGETFEMECEGLLAVCIQHEIDHLDGKLFVDYLSAAKRNLIRDKMKKYEKKLAKEQTQPTETA